MYNRSYFSRLVTGRINRAGNIVGPIVAAVFFATLFVITYSLLSAVVGLSTAVAISLPIYFVSIYFIIISFTIRRLHDLNKSGYLVIFLLPSLMLPTLIQALTIIAISFTQVTPVLAFINTITTNSIYPIYNFISGIFWLYVTFWPGTKGNNRYGIPSTHWTIKEILGFAKPASSTTSYINPKTNPVKPLLKILLGLVLFLVAFLAIIFAIIFIKNLT
jgi:uncharacterized membrane protein YhaH (DUF805 family)